jgi:hypothetical protein
MLISILSLCVMMMMMMMMISVTNGACPGECDRMDICCDENCNFRGRSYICGQPIGPCDGEKICEDNSPDNCLSQLNYGPCAPAPGVCAFEPTCGMPHPGQFGSCLPAPPKPPTTMCRPANPMLPCDAPEYCDGVSYDCPSDKVAPSNIVCRPAASSCDVVEFCDGFTSSCPADSWAPSTTMCRESAGACDAPEFCTGAGIECPVDRFRDASVVCRARAGVCDLPEYAWFCFVLSMNKKTIKHRFCSGTSANCAFDDAKESSTTVCRMTQGPCDVEEMCDGVNNTCPPDQTAPAGQLCRAADSAQPCVLPTMCVEGMPTCPLPQFAAIGTACGVDLQCTGDGRCVSRDELSTLSTAVNTNDSGSPTLATINATQPSTIVGTALDDSTSEALLTWLLPTVIGGCCLLTIILVAALVFTKRRNTSDNDNNNSNDDTNRQNSLAPYYAAGGDVQFQSARDSSPVYGTPEPTTGQYVASDHVYMTGAYVGTGDLSQPQTIYQTGDIQSQQQQQQQQQQQYSASGYTTATDFNYQTGNVGHQQYDGSAILVDSKRP